MIARLLKGSYSRLELYHVRMAFSDSFQTVGRFRFGKTFHLARITLKAIRAKFQHHIEILYYPPAGPELIPIIRDLIILAFLRPFFKKKIYHFRAAGVSEFMSRKPKPLVDLARLVYGKPDLAIQLSDKNPADGNFFKAKKTVVIPNGIEDEAAPLLRIPKKHRGSTSILFVGVLTESKGIMVLLESAKLLRRHMSNFALDLVGEFDSGSFDRRVREFIRQNDLNNIVNFHGVLTGAKKWERFLCADIFCFPSHFPSESFGNVLLEAMSFELPVVATRWRGIPDIVVEGETGFLVPVKDPQSLARSITILLSDQELRVRMGENGRQRYLSNYSLKVHLKRMEEAIVRVAENKD